MARKLQGDEARREARRIREPAAWPHRPWLPLKRFEDGQADAQHGVIHESALDAGRLRVFDVALGGVGSALACVIADGHDPGLPIAGVYRDVEAMLDAGWMGH